MVSSFTDLLFLSGLGEVRVLGRHTHLLPGALVEGEEVASLKRTNSSQLEKTELSAKRVKIDSSLSQPV